MMKTEAQIAHNLHNHGVTGDKVRSLMLLAKSPGAPVSEEQIAVKPAPRVRPKNLEEFRKMHDNPQKIRNGLANLVGSTYLTEEEFRQFCNIPATLWRRNAELPEFADHKLKHAGVVYWASKKTIQEMKTIIGSA